MQEDNIAIRLKFLIADLGITSSIFADNCGISRATLSQLLTGRNKKISDVLISQIHKAYPTLSILWLLFNEGPMWNEVLNLTESNNLDSVNNEETGSASINDTKQTHLSSKDLHNPSPLLSPSENDQTIAKKNDEKYKDNDSLFNAGVLAEHNLPQSQNNFNQTELLNEIELLRKKVRKVIQITIYYDDSTFETFYPK